MENQFNLFNLSNEIIKALHEMGYEAPTQVQAEAIPMALENKDLIVVSKTGSGKTAAFGVPMIEKIQKGRTKPQALVMAPTRELAVQVDQEIRNIAKYKHIRSTVIYGGHSMVTEVEKLEKGVELVVGTPGRIYDHMKQGNLDLSDVKFLVLDEADRMLDMGFLDQVQRIVKEIPRDRVTMLFSATMPEEIQSLCHHYMRNPQKIEIESDTKTVDAITQYYYKLQPNEKRFQLDRILRMEQPESCMVFCNTRMTVDRVNIFLNEKGYTSKALHGANSQSSRMHSIQQFKKGGFEILVATDVAARGLHVDDLSLVINYDVPQDKDNYIHRIGRTGRAGQGGKALSLVTKDDQYTLYEIEEHIGTLIEELPLPTDEDLKDKPKKVPPKPSQAPAKPSATQTKSSATQTKSRPSQGKSSSTQSRSNSAQPHTNAAQPRSNSTQPRSNAAQSRTNTAHPKSSAAQSKPYPSRRSNHSTPTATKPATPVSTSPVTPKASHPVEQSAVKKGFFARVMDKLFKKNSDMK